jgi:hypothetical protein
MCYIHVMLQMFERTVIALEGSDSIAADPWGLHVLAGNALI